MNRRHSLYQYATALVRTGFGFNLLSGKNEERIKIGKPRITDLRPRLWGAALRECPEHLFPLLHTGRSVLRGKGNGRGEPGGSGAKGIDRKFSGPHPTHDIRGALKAHCHP